MHSLIDPSRAAENQVEGLPVGCVQGMVSGQRDGDDVAAPLQQRAVGGGDVRVVLDEEDAQWWPNQPLWLPLPGNVTISQGQPDRERGASPVPGPPLAAHTVPSCISTMLRTTASPRPNPPAPAAPGAAARTNASMRVSASSGSKPGPVSRTLSSARPSRLVSSTVTSAWPGVCLRALSRRLATTCPSRTRHSVIALFEFHGTTEDMAAGYDVLHKVVAVSSARPVIHLAVPTEYGLMVIDVWNSKEAFTAFREQRRLPPGAAGERAT
jgi:hypothetical protein